MNIIQNHPEQSTGFNFLERFDPRVKIISFSLFILAVAFTPPQDMAKFLGYFLLIIMFLFISSVSFKLLIIRLLFILPLLGFISLSVFLFGGHSSSQNFSIVWNFGVKCVLIFLCVILLALCTGFYRLIKGLELLKIPSIFISVIALAYRYSFLFAQEAERMRRAKDSRTFGQGKRMDKLRLILHILPHLFFRSLERSERVYAAMLSRGFDRKVRTLGQLKMRKKDWLFAFSFIIYLGLVAVFL